MALTKSPEHPSTLSDKIRRKLISLVILSLFLIANYVILNHLYVQICPNETSYYWVITKFFILRGVATMILINVVYSLLYYAEIPFIEKFKVNDLEWPWKSNPAHFYKILPGSIKTYIFNYAMFNVYLLLLGLFPSPSIDVKTIPNFPLFLFHFFLAIFLEDFFFYWGHRFLHIPSVYSKIHKKHHEFYNVIHISCLDTHWIEFLISNVMPLCMSAIVLGNRIHVTTFLIWNFFRILETHESHSGYEFPWSMTFIMPYSTDSAYHNFHHLKNVGNYSSFFKFWDTMFGTNSYYYKLKAESQGPN